MIWIGIVIAIAIIIGLVSGVEKMKYGEYEEVSWLYFSFGMYTWFQVLTLAPFWLLFSIACLFWWTPPIALKAYILFHTIRSPAEIILTHHNPNLHYVEKIIPALHQISPSLAKQMYAMIHLCITITCIYFLVGVFN